MRTKYDKIASVPQTKSLSQLEPRFSSDISDSESFTTLPNYERNYFRNSDSYKPWFPVLCSSIVLLISLGLLQYVHWTFDKKCDGMLETWSKSLLILQCGDLY